ncbi:unnamed protein product [Amoebophrya sp. A25]|nr:unnamed protein product [Amoebophrya sp. A25]|eukprot:GSA25T00005781001.1
MKFSFHSCSYRVAYLSDYSVRLRLHHSLHIKTYMYPNFVYLHEQMTTPHKLCQRHTSFYLIILIEGERMLRPDAACIRVSQY